MIDLFKYHLRFVKKPSQTLLEEYSGFSIKTGIGVFVLYMGYALLGDPRQTQIAYDLLSAIFDINSLGIIYLFTLFSITLGIVNHYWIVPFFLKFLSPKEAMDDGSSYRKIIFLSLLPYVTFVVLVLLPLNLLSVLLLIFNLSIFAVAIKLIAGLIEIWLLVLLVQALIMTWNGLKKVYSLSSLKVFAIMFLLPLLSSIPVILIFGNSYLEFISKYLNI